MKMIKLAMLLLVMFQGHQALSQAGSTNSASKDSVDENLAPVYDLDSNKYSVVKVGKQYWLQQNLRTSKYNDTTAIATGLDAKAWKEASKGAYAVYENNPANEAIYGKLYNGYAVATGKLCPRGWHIPTDKEWQELEAFIGVDASELNRTGGRSNLAGALKSKELWKASDAGGNNKTGLNVLPAGTRTDVGDFVTLNQFGAFWTSTQYETAANYLWYRHYYFNINELGRNYVIKNNGYSCRCIKDVKPSAKGPAGKPAVKPKTMAKPK